MDNPCDNCSVKFDQAEYKGEVTCYRTCKDFKEWIREQDAVADNSKHPA